MQPPRLSKREPSETSSDKCTKNDKSALCGKPAETNNVTLPVVLGILYGFFAIFNTLQIANWSSSIPLGAALILFFFLHRRHVRKLRQEDANDPHKSLDFGLGPSAGRKKRKTGSQKKSGDPSFEKPAAKHEHGMSMDIVSPYLLPPGLQSSHESLHSLSRTMHGGEDRYQPATALVTNDSTSLKSYPDARRGADESSSLAGSAFSGQGYGNDTMSQSLLQNAQRMSTSLPLKQHEPLAGPSTDFEPRPSDIERAPPRKSSLSPGKPADARDANVAYSGSDLRKSNNYLGPLIQSGDPSSTVFAQKLKQPPNDQSTAVSTANQQFSGRKSPPPALNPASGVTRPPRLESLNAAAVLKYQGASSDEASYYGEVLKVTPPSPEHSRNGQRNGSGRRSDQGAVPPLSDKKVDMMEAPLPAFDVRRLSMGFRPLPPDDPTDNPEQRANRIRSFYKEYFDDSRPSPMRPAIDYHEDNQSYFGDGSYYGQAGGHFVMAQPPFAAPPARRAMTPPPRGPPRFQGQARHHAASLSGGGFTPPGPRSFSSASNHLGVPIRGSSRPALPPPGPLRILPSPHLIKEDSFGIPIDFAPPTSYKDRQAGRPESPKGGMRPYSPMIPAHVPLVSSFDDLSVMPSPCVPIS